MASEFQLPDWYFIVQLSYGIPLICLYIFMAVIMFTKPKVFSSSYFVITKTGIVCDIVLYMAYSAYYRFCGNSITGYWFASIRPSVFTTFIYWCYYYTKIQRMGFILLLVINRGTAIIFPHSYFYFWNKYTHLSIFIVFLFPFTVTWTYFTATVIYMPLRGVDAAYTMFGIVPNNFPNLTVCQHSLTLVLVVISATINIVCLCKLYRNRKPNRGTVFTSTAQKKSEFSLFMIALFESIIETFEALVAVYMTFNLFYGDSRVGSVVFANNSWLVDLTIFSRPILLFFGSKLVRKTILKFCHLENSTITLSVVPSRHARSVVVPTMTVTTFPRASLK